MFRRKGVFYVHDNQSGKQTSLHTRSRADAERLYHAKNESAQGPLLNRDLGRVYLSASDPDATKRTWSAVMEELRSHGRASTHSATSGPCATPRWRASTTSPSSKPTPPTS